MVYARYLRKGCSNLFWTATSPISFVCKRPRRSAGEFEVDLPDYREYWNSAVKKGYSGTAIFFEAGAAVRDLGFPEKFAARFAFADELQRDAAEERPRHGGGIPKIPPRDRLYAERQGRPQPLGAALQALGSRTSSPIASSWEKRKPVIFCGDLNVAHTELDLANPKPNRGKKGFTDEERGGFQNLLDAGFVDTFRLFTQGNGHYSWWSHFANSRARNVGWRIDYVLVSGRLRGAVKSRPDLSRTSWARRSLPGHRSRCINPQGRSGAGGLYRQYYSSRRDAARYRGGYRVGAEPHLARWRP